MLSSAERAADNVGICSSLTDVKDRHSFLVMTDIGDSSVLVSRYSFVKDRDRLQPPCALASALEAFENVPPASFGALSAVGMPSAVVPNCKPGNASDRLSS